MLSRQPVTPVFFHHSRYPQAVAKLLHKSLGEGVIDPQFHYKSYRQSALWQAVHETCAPKFLSENDIYVKAAREWAPESDCTVISLGCGGGSKDLRILRQWADYSRSLGYVACDVSPALALTASWQMNENLPLKACRAVVADLGTADDLPTCWDDMPDGMRLFFAFGLLPNFSPFQLLSSVCSWMKPGDRLMVSANLAGEDEYEKNCQQILAQYDNEPTRRWLLQLPRDLGIGPEDARLSFHTDFSAGWCRIIARLDFLRSVEIEVEGTRFICAEDSSWQLFFSNRPHVGHWLEWLRQGGFKLVDEIMVDNHAGEGVALVEKI